MFRSVNMSEAQGRVTRSSTSSPDIGTIEIRADDWVFARHYVVRVLVAPSSGAGSTPPSSDQTTQQLTQAMLAGITYDYHLTLPGFVTSTNGLPGDDTRLTWHLALTSASERELTAESIYLDWPRILLVVIVLGVVGTLLYMRSRTGAKLPRPPA
jgi:hypothetical protein